VLNTVNFIIFKDLTPDYIFFLVQRIKQKENLNAFIFQKENKVKIVIFQHLVKAITKVFIANKSVLVFTSKIDHALLFTTICYSDRSSFYHSYFSLRIAFFALDIFQPKGAAIETTYSR